MVLTGELTGQIKILAVNFRLLSSLTARVTIIIGRSQMRVGVYMLNRQYTGNRIPDKLRWAEIFLGVCFMPAAALERFVENTLAKGVSVRKL